MFVHSAQTNKGHSGSPIMRIGTDGRDLKVVGLHSHKGYNNFNEGLRMTHL